MKTIPDCTPFEFLPTHWSYPTLLSDPTACKEPLVCDSLVDDLGDNSGCSSVLIRKTWEHCPAEMAEIWRRYFVKEWRQSQGRNGTWLLKRFQKKCLSLRNPWRKKILHHFLHRIDTSYSPRTKILGQVLRLGGRDALRPVPHNKMSYSKCACSMSLRVSPLSIFLFKNLRRDEPPTTGFFSPRILCQQLQSCALFFALESGFENSSNGVQVVSWVCWWWGCKERRTRPILWSMAV